MIWNKNSLSPYSPLRKLATFPKNYLGTFDSHFLLLIIVIIILHFSYKITFLFYFNLLNHYVTLNLELFSQIYGKYVM